MIFIFQKQVEFARTITYLSNAVLHRLYPCTNMRFSVLDKNQQDSEKAWIITVQAGGSDPLQNWLLLQVLDYHLMMDV